MKQNKTVRNCEIKYKKQCAYQWELLDATNEETVRYCKECKRKVYFCKTDEETLKHAEQGNCIARLIPDVSELPKMVLGEPDPKWVLANLPTKQQEDAQNLTNRERHIDWVLANIKYASKTCKLCGYPVPSWLTSCRVCSSSDFEPKG